MNKLTFFKDRKLVPYSKSISACHYVFQNEREKKSPSQQMQKKIGKMQHDFKHFLFIFIVVKYT